MSLKSQSLNASNFSNLNCPICNGPLITISPRTVIYQNDGHGWENDSTMELANFSKTVAFAGFCKSCFHTIRLPKFDTSKLYGTEATQTRAKYFAKYFPDKIYGETSAKIEIGSAFVGASLENKRFAFIGSKIGNFLKGVRLNGNTIKILDWGGGDGSVGNQYSSILKYVTSCKVDYWVFDYATWKHGDDEKRLSPKTIKNQAPFDIVILSHVLEHTNDPTSMINDIREILSIGGILILEVPDERINIVRALLRKKITLHYHIARYSRRSLCKLLNQCGLYHFQTYYHFNSSYHGSPMTTVLAIAQKPKKNIKPQANYPSVCIEIISLIIFTFKKIIFKLSRP